MLKPIYRITLLFFLLFGNYSFAQFNEFVPDSLLPKKFECNTWGNYGIGSDAITIGFFNKFYGGGYIDSTLKDRVLDNMISYNRLGGDINYGVGFSYKFKSSVPKKHHFTLLVGAKNREHFNLFFPIDLYKVAFYGNQSFAGSTANFDKFNFNIFRYQQFQVGAIWDGIDSTAKIGGAISYLQGQQHMSILMRKGKLTTAADGSSIDFATDLTARVSDTTNTSFMGGSGYGFSADVFFQAPYRLKHAHGKINIIATDLGFINWNSESLIFEKDTTYQYTGFTIDNIFDLQDSTFSSVNQDSAFKSLANFRKEKYTTTIPSMLHINTITYYGKHFQFIKGFQYRFNANYQGYFYVQGNWMFNKNFLFGVRTAYGGYAKFQFGADVLLRFAKNFILKAGFNNIEWLVMKNRATAQSAFVSLHYGF